MSVTDTHPSFWELMCSWGGQSHTHMCCNRDDIFPKAFVHFMSVLHFGNSHNTSNFFYYYYVCYYDL